MTDHCGKVAEYVKIGIPFYGNKDTADYVQNKFQQKIKTIGGKQLVHSGGFRISSFPLEHNVACVGFHIFHRELGTMLYITDTEYCKWKFKGINHMLIECNYDKRLISPEQSAKRTHVLKGHMELQTTKDFIRANKSPELRNIILCHMSQENIDQAVMLDEIKQVAGEEVSVEAATPGKEYKLKLFPWED